MMLPTINAIAAVSPNCGAPFPPDGSVAGPGASWVTGPWSAISKPPSQWEVAYGFLRAPAPPENSRAQIVPWLARGFPHPSEGELSFADMHFADCFHKGVSQFGRTIPVVHHLFINRFTYC